MLKDHLRVIKATFFETGTTQDMVSHALGTQVDLQIMNAFAERTREGAIVNPDVLAGIAGRIIRPDVNVERVVALPNGSNSVRYRFLMVVGNPNAMNGSIYYYSGYTDIVGYSINSNTFDPHMRLYFNNVIQVTQTTKMGLNGPVPHVEVVECNHLIHPATLGANAQMFQTTFDPMGGFGVQNQPTSLRPTDVMLRLSSQEKSKLAGVNFGEEFVDTRVAVDLCKSSRANSVPSNYLNKTIEGLLYGINSAANNPRAESFTPYDSAYGYVGESNVFEDRFFSLLANDYGYHQHGFICWGDMCRAHPELTVNGVVFLINRPQMQKRDMFLSAAGDYDPMVGDRRPQTVLVEQIMQSLPGVLISSMISFARIHVTNMNPGGNLMVTITDPISYANLGSNYIISKIPYLEQHLRQIVFMDIGFNQYVPFDAWFTVDTFGESFVRIAYNGETNYTPYSFATYSDAMATSLVSTDGRTLPTIAHDLNYLISHTCAL